MTVPHTSMSLIASGSQVTGLSSRMVKLARFDAAHLLLQAQGEGGVF